MSLRGGSIVLREGSTVLRGGSTVLRGGSTVLRCYHICEMYCFSFYDIIPGQLSLPRPVSLV